MTGVWITFLLWPSFFAIGFTIPPSKSPLSPPAAAAAAAAATTTTTTTRITNTIGRIRLESILWSSSSPSSSSAPTPSSSSSATASSSSSSSSSSKTTTPPPLLLLLPLEGVVCVVTGASRGIGKGIALALGREGATVYVTGTTTSTTTKRIQTKETLTSDAAIDDNNDVDVDDAPGTIEETADMVTQVGGRGIPVVCNHADDVQVKALFEQVEKEQGRLDLLVNNAFRIPSGGPKRLFGKFWEQDIEVWDSVHTVGLRSHYVASCYAIPLLLKSKKIAKLPRPMIAMISSFGGLTYSFNVAYGVAKAGVDRLVKDMTVELGDDICVSSFWPGVVLTERTKIMVENGQWQESVGLDLTNAESPEFTGRAICAVLKDPNNGSKSGKFHVVAELAQEYQFTDLDGTTPPSIRSLKFLLPAYAMTETQREKFPLGLIPDWKLPFWIMASGRPPSEENDKKARAI